MAPNPDNTSIGEVDFESVYQGGQLAEGAPSERIPWDIGEAQPVLVELEEDGQIQGAVLDVGCGLGDNAVFLAERGYRVTGVDMSASAVEQARGRAAEHDVAVEFAVADATQLHGFDNRFDTVIDSALMHCFAPEQRLEYVAALHRVTVPGGKVHVMCGADTTTTAIPVPFLLNEAALHEAFSHGWRVDDLETSLYTAAMDRQDFAGFLEAQGGPAEIIDQVEVDEAGRLRFPIWKLTATRL